jgi:hypothetical protein
MNTEYDFEVIQMVPTQNDQKIISNEMIFKGLDDLGISKFQPNGTYKFSSSSWSSDNTEAYKAFDNDSNTFWECDFKNNDTYDKLNRNYPAYSQNPYNEVSIYQSGGTVETIATTQVGVDKMVDVLGEWMQIILPYKSYLFDYSIRTPQFGKNNTFPTKFTLVGSNDGQQWDMIKEHNDFKDGLPPMPIVKKTYHINSKQQYSYYRFIFNRSGKNMNVIKINNITLSGTRELVENPNVNKETFSLIGRQNTIKHALESFVNGDNISLENSSTCKTCTNTNKKHDIVTYCGLTGILVLSVVLFLSRRTKR